MPNIAMNRSNMMKAIAISVLALILAGCGSVALTGRKQLLLVSDQEVFEAGLTQYNEYIASSQLSSDVRSSAMVPAAAPSIIAS